MVSHHRRERQAQENISALVAECQSEQREQSELRVLIAKSRWLKCRFQKRDGQPSLSQKEKIMIYGYARCSTNETKQDINRQVRELKAAGAEEIYLEYEHGDSGTKRKQIELFTIVREGDTIIALEVPRLARSTKQLCEIIELVAVKRLKLIIVGSITLDCTKGEIDPTSKAFIQMAGVFAELEVGMIRQRVKSGMANAKAKGVRIGRPELTKDDIPAIFYRHYPSDVSGALNITELARVCDMSRTRVYRYIKILK